MSQFQVVHFKFISSNFTKRFLLVQPSFDTVISKLRSLSPGFQFMEVQDREGDWIRVDNDDEWHYMKLILNLDSNDAYIIRDGGEFCKIESKNSNNLNSKNHGMCGFNDICTFNNASNLNNHSNENNTLSSTRSENTIKTLSTIGGALGTLGTSAVTGAIGIISAAHNAKKSNNDKNDKNDKNVRKSTSVSSTVVQSAVPVLIDLVAKNPQLLTSTVSALATLGSQSSSLMQSITKSQVSNSTNQGSSNVSNSCNNLYGKNNGNLASKAKNDSSSDIASSILLQILKSGNQQLNVQKNQNGDQCNSQNIKYQEHVTQGLYFVENLLKKANEVYSSYSSTKENTSSEIASESSNVNDSSQINQSQSSQISQPQYQANLSANPQTQISIPSLQITSNKDLLHNENIHPFFSSISSGSSMQNPNLQTEPEYPTAIKVDNPDRNFHNTTMDSNSIEPFQTQSQTSAQQQKSSVDKVEIEKEMLPNLSLLSSMNFKDSMKNAKALKLNNNNLNAAVQYLLNNP